MGNREIEAVVRKYSDMVYRIALLNMKNKSDAEDIFQEVFLRLVQHLHKLKTEEHRKAWLIRVTINCCKKQFGSAWRRNVLPLADEAIPETAVYDEMPQEEVYLAVKQLPGIYKQVIHLFYFEDMSIKMIATTLKAKESTVKSQLSRGRQMLKDILGEEYDYGEKAEKGI